MSSGTGPYSARFWLQVNGTDLLGSDGTAVRDLNSLSQAKYTKLIANAKPGDKVWAKVRVYDQSINKTSEAEIAKVIGQYEDVPTPEPTPPPAPEPVPPVAVINAPSEVIQGDDVYISSGSYDPDGTIVNYSWSIIPSSGVVGTLSGESGTVSFDKVGTYTVRLTVTDNDGLTDTAQKTIEVKPAVPKAFFDYTGALKENRKVVLDASGSYTSPKYPMVWDATEWEITPASSGLTQNDIKIVPSTDMKTRTVLFKKAGDYRVRVRVKNSAGNYSDWYERTLTVVEDLPPVADFFVMTTALRDPSNGNMAKIDLIDASYSPDGDKIVQRIWKYKYDSNNNGSFDDEQWITLDSGNNTHPVLYAKDVGKYLFELSVKEDFGEETIPEFISPSDYKTSDTSNKPMKDKICEVINLQPVVDFEMYEKKKAELVIRVGKLNNYDARVKQLEDGINNLLIPLLNSKNIDAKVIDSDFGTGTCGGNTSILVFNDLSFLDYNDNNAKTKFANAINQLSSKLVIAGQTTFPASQADGLISLITNGGFKVIDNSISNQLTAIAEYIAKDLENQQRIIEKYVVLGEPIEIKTYYNDPENDPKYEERWMYLHDPNYFENSLGLASFNGQYLSSPVTVFDKVGKYEVEYQARDNPKDGDRFDNYRLGATSL
ncbi:PKD domain-containing protein [Thermoanaerobacter sp. CM-CNRG TB177]|uniref:PKD domain-containing protein n=1 Tax=Thermoanaerobacter sp. CM-CNRG TB177 TaxID=2800659 RepID=UPI0021079855|nr:PKD domain-containing protein [Thermoanaerobacter sp. CM-CNRG TB177]